MWLLQIANEMDIICRLEKTISLFENKWKHYVNIILEYSRKDLKVALNGLSTDDSSGENGMRQPCTNTNLSLMASYLVTHPKAINIMPFQ